MDDYVIAKYIRLSTEDSNSDSMSIANQRLMLDKYIADMDIPSMTVLEFVDNGYSGVNFERPAVQELLDLVREGKVNCIVVKDFSRFGRNALETGHFIERVFPLYRTRFISACDNYDSDEHEGGTGGIEVALKFLVHEHYSRDLSKKIRAAKHEKARRGEFITKNSAFGFVKSKDNRLEIDHDAADTVRLIFKLASEGKSLSAIARELYKQQRLTPTAYKKHKRIVTQDMGFNCVWEVSVIHKILRDEQYTGTYVAGKSESLAVGSRATKKIPESEWIRIPGHHPAIVSNEVFERVQAATGVKGEPGKKRNRQHSAQQSTLKGKVVCGCCGHKMPLTTTKNPVFYCKFTRSALGAECYGLRILASELESALFEIISKQAQVALGVDSLIEVNTVALHNMRQSECKRSIEQASDAKRGLYERFTLGEIQAAEYMSWKAEIDADIDRLNRAFAALGEQLAQKQSEAETGAKICKVVSSEGGLSQAVVDTLIEKVRVYPGNRIEVEWKIVGLCDGEIGLPT